MIFKQNLVYFIANNTKYDLTILSRYKKIKSVHNRTGTNIEISTILVRMENFVFFYGFIKNYIPNRGCILNLEPREWDIFLGESPTRVHVVDFQYTVLSAAGNTARSVPVSDCGSLIPMLNGWVVTVSVSRPGSSSVVL